MGIGVASRIPVSFVSRGHEVGKAAVRCLMAIALVLGAAPFMGGCSHDGSVPVGAASNVSNEKEVAAPAEPPKWLLVAKYTDDLPPFHDNWTTYEYSEEGLLLREYCIREGNEEVGNDNLVTNYGYDDSGTCTERIFVSPHDNGSEFTYWGSRIGAYDDLGRPCGLIDLAGDESGESKSVLNTWEYVSSDTNPLPGYTAYGEDGSLKSQVTREYDADGNKTYEEVYVDDENYRTYEYEYDENGNMIFEKYENVLSGRQQYYHEISYWYDAAGNLVYQGNREDPSSGCYYAYDDRGNRLQELTFDKGVIVGNTIRVFNPDDLLLMELECSSNDGLGGSYLPWSLTTYEYVDEGRSRIVSGARYCRDRFHTGFAVEYPWNTESLVDVASVYEGLFGEDASFLQEQYDYVPDGGSLVFDATISTDLDTDVLPKRIVDYLSVGDCGLGRTGYPFELDGKGWNELKKAVDDGRPENGTAEVPGNAYDVQTGLFAFNLPDSWEGKVDVDIRDADGEYPVAIISLKLSDCPPILCASVRDSSEELLGGDISSSIFERLEIPNGKRIDFSTCYFLATLMEAREFGADSPFSLTDGQYEDIFEMTLGSSFKYDAVSEEQIEEIRLASFDAQTDHLKSEIVDKVIVGNFA